MSCQLFKAGDINALIRGAFDLKAAKEAAKAVVGRDGRVMSQSQATTERMLKDHAKTITWADITLGMTRKQIKEHEKELAVTARRETEMENDYNFEDGHSVDPGKGKKDDSMAATLAMRVSLGDTEYNKVNGDDSFYLNNLAEELYEDDDNCRDMDIKMAVVHQDTGCTLALQDGKGKDTAKDDEEVEKQLDTPDRNAGMQDGEDQSATLSTHLSAGLACATIHTDKAQLNHDEGQILSSSKGGSASGGE
jgi:hypothetical protein